MQLWSKVSKMSSQDIKSMQDSLLVSMIKDEMTSYHPYYQKLFAEKGIDPQKIKGTDDLKELPFTTKKEVAPDEADLKRPKQFILEQIREDGQAEKKKGFLGKLFKKKEAEEKEDYPYRMVQLFYTRGKVEKMVPLVFTALDLRNLKETGMRSFEFWGLEREDSTINAFSYLPHVSFWQIFYTTVEIGSTALQTGGGRVLGAEKILKALFNLEATTLITFPGYAEYCLQILNRFGFMMPTLEKIVLGMDDAPPSLIKKIQEGMEKAGAKDTQVFRSYYLSEAKGGWPECSPGYGYHIHPDHVFVEIVDPETGERKNEEEPGEIVITNLDARGTVFLRFRSGDIATGGMTTKPCPNCGRTVPRILGDIDRLDRIFELNLGQDKKEFNFNELRRLLLGMKDLSQWYVEINREGESDRLKLVACSGIKENEPDLGEKIHKYLEQENFDIPIDIDISSYEDITQRQGMEKGVTECRIFDKRNK